MSLAALARRLTGRKPRHPTRPIEITTIDAVCSPCAHEADLTRPAGNAVLIERPGHSLDYRPPDLSNDPFQATLLPEQGLTGISGHGLMSYDMVAGRIAVGPEFLAVLDNVEVEGATFLHYLTGDRAIADLYHDARIFPRALKGMGRLVAGSLEPAGPPPRFVRPVPREIVEIDEPVFSPFGPWWSNHFHFLMDVLPRLRALDTHPILRDMPILAPVIPPDSVADQVLRALRLRDRVIDIRADAVRCRRLYFPSMMNPGGISAAQAAFVRDLTLRAFRVQPDPAPRALIYATRRDARKRRIVNEDTLEAALTPRGFTTFVATGASAEAQARAFANARLVIGPHGANLANVVFAPDRADLIEIAPAIHCHPSYWMLARQKGMRYGLLAVADSDANLDMRVDVEAVCAMVDRMLGS